MIPECSRQILEEYTNIKFHENISSDTQVVPYGRTDRRTGRHEETNSSFFGILRTRLKVFQTDIVEKIKTLYVQKCFSENHDVIKIMWKNTVKLDRPQVTIECGACALHARQPQAAESHLECEFDLHVTVHHDKFLIIKPTRCTNFSNLFLE